MISATGVVANDFAIIGNAMAMTVESKLSMKNAVATIEATTSGRA